MKIQIPNSIRVRLTLWYAVVLAIIFIISNIVLYYVFKGNLMANVDSTLIYAAEQAEQAILKVPFEKWREQIKRVEREFLVNRLFIQILGMPEKGDDDFALIARSGVLSGNISQREIWKLISYQMPKNPMFMNANEGSRASHPLRIILYPVKKGNGGRYLIEVGTSLKKVSSTLRDFLIILLISGPMMLMISALGGFMLLTKAIRPVKLVVQTARRITTEDLSHRIPSKNRKDEIGQLIITFNEMISRLEQSVSKIKQFSIDASHDLKTPLTIIRGEIEITLRKERTIKDYRKTLVSVHEEAKKLESIVNNLLFLSRIDAVDHRSSLKQVSLDEILLNVFEKIERLAEDKHLVYVLRDIQSLSIEGDDILLTRLITNILDNAIKYTPDGGRIEISLVKIDNCAQLEVRDTGIGIPKESLPFIFDRFYRVDKARSQQIGGSGLGLSIVKKIADIHHAEIQVDSVLNKGTTVEIVFPNSI